MVRICIGERFEADKAHEFIDFMAFLIQQTARDETGLDVLSDSQPGEQVWVLKDETALGAWTGDAFVANSKFAGVGEVEAGDEAKKGGFATTARTENGNEFARSERERDILEGENANFGMVWGRKVFGDAKDTEGSAFVGGRRDAARSASSATFASSASLI